MQTKSIIDMINEDFKGDRNRVAEKAGVSIYQLNNWVSKKRNVAMLKGGGFIVLTSRSQIIPA